MKTSPPTKEEFEALRYAGRLGHRFVVLVPVNASELWRYKSGLRVSAECNTLESARKDVQDNGNNGMIFEQLPNRKWRKIS